jgi:hypothetical protein
MGDEYQESDVKVSFPSRFARKYWEPHGGSTAHRLLSSSLVRLLVLSLCLVGCNREALVVGAPPDLAPAPADLAAAPPGDLARAPDFAGPPPCTSSSSLAGVSIVPTTGQWTYTLAEAKAGLVLRYEVVVGAPVADVIPQPADLGGCGQPGASGLILSQYLSGNGQSYCVCDTGLCAPPSNTAVVLQPGMYPDQFMWDGRNWMGPSDTGNPEGPPFPAGTYQLRISAKGQHGGSAFEVAAVCDLTLVP